MRVLGSNEVMQLLRSEMERAGGPSAYSRKLGVDRATLHRVLNGREGPSKKIIKVLGINVVYASNQRKGGRTTVAPLSKRSSDIAVVPSETRSELLVFINGRRVKATPSVARVLACLLRNRGCVVSYDQLYSIVRFRSTAAKKKAPYLETIHRVDKADIDLTRGAVFNRSVAGEGICAMRCCKIDQLMLNCPDHQ
jgi:hypothetical protein